LNDEEDLQDIDEIIEPIKQLIKIEYSIIIEEGKECVGAIFKSRADINLDIARRMHNFDPALKLIKNNLLIAVRLSECIKIFDWITLSLLLGSYRSVNKELRFMLESMCQAFYIDYNHFSTPIETKIEILKALGNYGNFIGGQLIDKTKLNKSLKKEIKKIYGHLSDFIHPSFEESKILFKRIERIRQGKAIRIQDDLEVNKFDKSSVMQCLENCYTLSSLVIKISEKFEELFVKQEIP
jgi:hypothetical protein